MIREEVGREGKRETGGSCEVIVFGVYNGVGEFLSVWVGLWRGMGEKDKGQLVGVGHGCAGWLVVVAGGDGDDERRCCDDVEVNGSVLLDGRHVSGFVGYRGEYSTGEGESEDRDSEVSDRVVLVDERFPMMERCSSG